MYLENHLIKQVYKQNQSKYKDQIFVDTVNFPPLYEEIIKRFESLNINKKIIIQNHQKKTELIYNSNGL